ncbi:MAG: 30S ribosomal protein S4 [Clostridiales bacterium]|nr:30S ribosomal protein S4 [Clostridiales bacterium]
MARYTGPACKLCRRENQKLFLKGDRCTSGKCAIDRRGTAPGQHGAQQKKLKEYGMQLREKQKARRYYGVLEKQFKGYYSEAERQNGVTGETLLSLLERRFDNVVYRMGMASSRREARQLVLHAHFRLNGKKANIPSIILKVGDTISIREESRDNKKIKELLEVFTDTKGAGAPWLDIDRANGTAKVTAIPKREDIDFEVDEQLIVELYSK